MKHLSAFRVLAVTILGFAMAMTANTIEPAIIGRKVLELAPGHPNTALGLTTLAGLLVAVLVQPIAGVFSDRTRSPWGRRLPYLVGGTAFVIVCLYAIALAPALLALVAGVLLLYLALNIAQGPWQALIPDQLPQPQHGRAAGVKALFDILGFVAGRSIGGLVMSRYAEWGTAATLVAVTIPAVAFVAALVLTAAGAREKPGAGISSQTAPATPKAALQEAFVVDFHNHPAFRRWFANRLLFWSGAIALNTFLLFYLMNVVRMPEGEADAFIARLSLVLGLGIAVVTIPAGWLADRVGRTPLLLAAAAGAACGTVIMLFGRTPDLLTLAGLLVGVSTGLFLSASWALVTDIVPAGEAAHYLGIANIAGAGGSALARLLGGILIDPLNALLGSPAAGYLALFSIAGCFFLLSGVAILPLGARQSEAEQQTPATSDA